MLLDNVKRLCLDHGITIAELEKSADIGNGTIGRWSMTSPKLKTVKKVADYFGVTVDELLTDHGAVSDCEASSS